MYKIAVVGPESTGKSALSQALATHYNGIVVPEYAREYVEKLQGKYNYEDVCTIARHQIQQEKLFEQNNLPGFVFFDTDLIITKVWFEYCYAEVPEYVTEQLHSGFIDLYLLCTPDLPWEPDPVREHGHDRDFFFEWYKKEIELLNTPYHMIDGYGEARTRNAIRFIEQYTRLSS